MTALDVARLAGVSRSAVSRTLTAGASVADDTRRRVLEAADQLGYRPNLMARTLMTQRSKVVALVMGHLRNPFFTNMLGLFNEQLRANGYQTLLQIVSADFGVEQAVEAALQYQLDGILMASCHPSAALAARCHRYQLPIVAVDRTSDQNASQIWIQSDALGKSIAARLLADGRKRLAVIEGTPGEPLSRRSRSFMQCAQSAGVSLTIDYGGYYYEGGREAAARLLRSASPPDAIFCLTDPMALGAIDAARFDAAIRVPQDLSIIGCGDIPAAAWPSFDLTTARLPLAEIVQQSVATLLARIEDPTLRPEHLQLTCPIVERGTTLPRVER